MLKPDTSFCMLKMKFTLFGIETNMECIQWIQIRIFFFLSGYKRAFNSAISNTLLKLIVLGSFQKVFLSVVLVCCFFFFFFLYLLWVLHYIYSNYTNSDPLSVLSESGFYSTEKYLFLCSFLVWMLVGTPIPNWKISEVDSQ